MEIKDIKFKTKKHTVLRGITLSFNKNEYIGILGSSGAGKTTLLNLASGRVKQKDIKLYDGSFIFNNETVINKIDISTLDYIKRKTGYVYQHDVLPGLISVFEYMSFVVDLANNKKEPQPIYDTAIPVINENPELTKSFLIQRIIKSLRLDGNQKIENLSGGERKRTAIGLELLHAQLTGNKDHILFLDEPTTGLDNGTALTVIQLLKSIEGTKICTIHQPTPRILNLFDRIIILHNGRIFFNGTSSELKNVVQNLNVDCSEDVIDVVFTDILPEVKWKNGVCMYKEEKVTFNSGYDNYNQIDNNVESLSDLKIYESSNTERNQELKTKAKTKTFITELSILLGRLARTIRNKPFILVSRFFQALVISLVLSPIFYNLKAKQLIILNGQITGFLYQCTLNIFYSAGMGGINLMYENYELLKREYQHNYYSVNSYYLAKVLEGMVLHSFLPIISPPIMILATRIPMTIRRFFVFFLVNWLVSMNGLGIAILFGSIFEDQQYALIALSLTLLPLATISGLLVDPEELSFVFRIIQYLSPPRYAFNAQIKNYFSTLETDEKNRKRRIAPENKQLVRLSSKFLSVSWSIFTLFFLFLLVIFIGLLVFKRRIKKL
ncbi:ATP-binding cassette sub-family G member 4 [Cucumispora dikerogammari]|nr:ATP-binding cassette sub-family G member 4 [Cucumispora dikerogammari]